MTSLKISTKHHKHLNNPFPANPRFLGFLHGHLFINRNLPQTLNFKIGEHFLLIWSSNNGGFLSVSHKSEPNRAIWSTIPGTAFVSAGFAETKVEESRGSFAISDSGFFFCDHQTVEEIRLVDPSEIDPETLNSEFQNGVLKFDQNSDFPVEFMGTQQSVFVITGWVYSSNGFAEHGFERFFNGDKSRDPFGRNRELNRKKNHGRRLFIAARYCFVLEQKTSHQIGFKVRLGKPNLQFRPGIFPSISRNSWKLLPNLGWLSRRHFWHLCRPRGCIEVSSEERERFGGFAERGMVEISELNRVFVTYSSEEDERFYGFGEQFSHMEFKGRRVPIFVQEQGVGRGDQPISFAANLVSYRSGGDSSTTYAPSPFYMTSKMRSLYLEGYSYYVFDLTKQDRVQIQVYSGSAQGRILHGSSPVEIIERFTDTSGRLPELPEWIVSGAVVGMQGGTHAVRHVWDLLQKHDVPLSAFWLQDWVGQRETIIGSQLWWNWEVDASRYEGWLQLVKDLRACDIRVMTYCNPCLVPIDDKSNRKRNLFEEASKLGLLVKDKYGETYMVPNTSFDVGMLDLTNPATGSWFKQILQEMVDGGVRGWMADFGEGLPLDSCLFSGEDPVSAHNRYPELWAKLNREFVDEWNLKQQPKEKEDPEESLLFFMRAGFRESPKWAMLFWEGDQMVSWQRNDGIKSSVVGLLSSGLSGYAFNHSDIGGYCAVNVPIIKYQRSEELLLRWMELNAFTTVFRTHEGNNPSVNSQFYSNNRTLSHFARFAKVYKAWKFYRIQLVKEAAKKGLPVSRHPFLHFPNDEHVQRLTYQQFLVGTEILMVPVLDKGKKEVEAYFPLTRGYSWQHIWTGKLYGPLSAGRTQGCKAWVEAPLGYPAVFVKSGSPIGGRFLKNLRDLGIL